MSTLSKSPLRVAREALAVATKVLRPYAHKFSPKLYTQPQLFVCLGGQGVSVHYAPSERRFMLTSLCAQWH